MHMSIPLWIADSDTKSSTVTACASAFNLTAAATWWRDDQTYQKPTFDRDKMTPLRSPDPRAVREIVMSSSRVCRLVVPGLVTASGVPCSLCRASPNSHVDSPSALSDFIRDDRFIAPSACCFGGQCCKSIIAFLGELFPWF